MSELMSEPIPSATLANLNPQQLQAVRSVQGPVLVLAGPGSGKTRVLTQRIAYMIDECGIAPWNILAVTFTNKAAREMRERVESLIGDRFGEPLPGQPARLGGLTIGTFHSLCARILRVETDAIGYQRNWVIYDSADQRALVRTLLREMNLDEKRYSPQAIRARISRQKNELITPKKYQSESYFEEIAGRVYTRYQEALQANNAMDFDDLLMKSTLLLQDNLELRVKYQEKWQYLLVDEFQDTNTAQYELLRQVANEPQGQRNFFAVGDEDQSIYRFRGADYRNVLRFREDYPDATIVLLEENYRSTQAILNVANSVIQNNSNRTPKRLRTSNGKGIAATVHEAYNEVEEASFICDEIERLVMSRTFELGEIAIMYRTNAQSRALEEAMVMRQIKYKLVGATRFYERKEIKDALAFLRLVHNPADSVALNRVINVPARGIGAKTHGALNAWATELGLDTFTALRILHHGAERVDGERLAQGESGNLPARAFEPPPFGKRAENALVEFGAMLEAWVNQNRQDRFATVADLLDTVMHDSGYVDMIRDGTDEGEDRFANIQELRSVASQYLPDMIGLENGQTPLSLFLEEVSLVSDVDDLDEGVGAVTLLTLHMAKGLEYPVVFMVGMEDGILPHSRSVESDDPEDMDEERRLCYVGITRAKRRLYFVHAFRRGLWGSSEVQQPSRFLGEVPSHYLSGMVDSSERRNASYQRATAWDDGDSGYGWSRRTQRRDNRHGVSGTSPSQNYWSPSSGRSGGGTGSQARKQSARSNSSQSDNLQYKRRDSVEHAKFGVGTVIESNLVGGEEEVTVAFPGVGIKRLAVSMAGLKKL